MRAAPLGLLSRLLREVPTPIEAEDVRGWWRAFRAGGSRGGDPIDQAILGGFRADRVGFAFVSGYQAALRALVGSAAEPGDDAILSFCATEPGGNQPRAIQTRLTGSGGSYRVSGTKRWSTMAPVADVLLVVASEGMDAAGRNRLRVAMIGARSPGVRIETMLPTPFIPEVPHAVIALTDVPVEEASLLPGDGYAQHVKPFRTVEDVHIHGALLGYLLSVARRHGFPQPAMERLAASVLAVRALAALDPSAAETHVALAGLLAQDAAMLEGLTDAWTAVPDRERLLWQRDRPLLGSVAGQVRELRRQRAWELITGESRPPSR